MSVVRSKKTVIPISRTRGEVSVPKCEPPNIAVMQHNMEQELERRRQLWEQDVRPIISDHLDEELFFKNAIRVRAASMRNSEVKLKNKTN